MNIYAKISEKANMEVDENGASLPVYVNLADAPENLTDAEVAQLISDLTEVPMEFITVIAKEEYDENVDEELLDCCGCSDCSCEEDDDEEDDQGEGCYGSCSGCNGGCSK